MQCQVYKWNRFFTGICCERRLARKANDRRVISQLPGPGRESKGSGSEPKKSFDQWQYRRIVCLHEAEANFDLDTYWFRWMVSQRPILLLAMKNSWQWHSLVFLLVTLHMSICNMPFRSFHLFQETNESWNDQVKGHFWFFSLRVGRKEKRQRRRRYGRGVKKWGKGGWGERGGRRRSRGGRRRSRRRWKAAGQLCTWCRILRCAFQSQSAASRRSYHVIDFYGFWEIHSVGCTCPEHELWTQISLGILPCCDNNLTNHATNNNNNIQLVHSGINPMELFWTSKTMFWIMTTDIFWVTTK